MRSFHRSLSLSILIATGIGCSTATIESKWEAPNAPTLTNVVTISPASDAVTRRTAEDGLAQQLAQHGVHATPAYSVLGDQDLADRGKLVQALSARGFDGIVAMRLVGASQKLEYYPGFDAYWGGAWGQVVPETVVRVEVNAYALPTKQLIWSAMSKSVDPNSQPQVIHDVSQVAAAPLAKDHVIGASKAATTP